MIPKISVVMSVYNGEKYLCEAIESILGQTFADFEFIRCDSDHDDYRSVYVHCRLDETQGTGIETAPVMAGCRHATGIPIRNLHLPQFRTTSDQNYASADYHRFQRI